MTAPDESALALRAPAASPIDTKRRIERCANVTCPNEIDEGWFVTVHLGDIEHRSVVVVLCVPCAGCF